MNVNYITDKKGNQSAVIIPIDEWNDLLKQFSKMKRKLEILTGVEDAVDEVNMAREGKIELKSFKDFLDEN